MLRSRPDCKRRASAPGLNAALSWPSASGFEDSTCKDVPGGIKVKVDGANGAAILENRDADPLVGTSAQHCKVILIFVLPEEAGLECGARGAVANEQVVLTPGELESIGNGGHVLDDALVGVPDGFVSDARERESPPTPPECEVADASAVRGAWPDNDVVRGGQPTSTAHLVDDHLRTKDAVHAFICSVHCDPCLTTEVNGLCHRDRVGKELDVFNSVFP
jgi:hypothetical protein